MIKTAKCPRCGPGAVSVSLREPHGDDQRRNTITWNGRTYFNRNVTCGTCRRDFNLSQAKNIS